jgi:hypothetical protein
MEMKKYLILLPLLFGSVACTSNPHPPVKTTMNPANAEATTAAFLATRQAETAMPTAIPKPARLVMLVCVDCAAQGGAINIWESAGWDPGAVLTSVPDQTKVEVLGTVVVEDGSTWYQVTVNGITGWVAAGSVGNTVP